MAQPNIQALAAVMAYKNQIEVAKKNLLGALELIDMRSDITQIGFMLTTGIADDCGEVTDISKCWNLPPDAQQVTVEGDRTFASFFAAETTNAIRTVRIDDKGILSTPYILGEKTLTIDFPIVYLTQLICNTPEGPFMMEINPLVTPPTGIEGKLVCAAEFVALEEREGHTLH